MTNRNVVNTSPTEPSRWEIMARERNARVIRCNTPDTYSLLDLARNADRVVRALRNRLLVSLEPEQVIPLLTRYKQSMMDLSDLLEDMSKACEMEYRTPRSILRMKGIEEEETVTTKASKKTSGNKAKKSAGNGDGSSKTEPIPDN